MTTIGLGLAVVSTGLWSGLLLTLTTILHPIYAAQDQRGFATELRLFLPVFQFPIRFIYAINPQPKKGDKFQTFQFTIGNTY